MDESLRERERRAAQNQLLFREVNERIASLAGRALLPEIAPIQVTCECVDMSCTTGVQIPLHEFAEIDRATNRFLVVPGHELPDVEDVVERRDRFLMSPSAELGRILSNGAPVSRAASNSATKALTRPRPEKPPPPCPPWAEPFDQDFDAVAGRGLEECAFVNLPELLVHLRELARERLGERARDTAGVSSLSGVLSA